MKKKLKTIVLMLLVAVMACDDYVEVDPIGPDADDYFNNEAEYESALIGAYDLLQASFWNVLTGVVASNDYLAGGDPFTEDQPTLQNIDRMNQTPSDENQLRDIWNLMYAGINRTNYVLEFKDKTEFEGKDDIIAQAYFLRAYYTFELVKFFGNIPLKVEERNGVQRIADARVVIGEEFSMVRTESIADAYSLIEEDLKEALSLNIAPIQDEPYKATRGATQALLGKVYLYHGSKDRSKFADAAAMLNNVIGGQYSLTTGSDYMDLFESSMENSSESVFEIQYTGVEGASWDCLQCSEGSYFVQFNGPRNFDSPIYRNGWGFCMPTLELYELYEDGDNRRDVTILDLREAQDSYSQGRDDSGFFNKKYIPRKVDEQVGANPLNHANNYRSIRYADVLLMAAEAEVESGGSNAENYLNQVRARAYGNDNNAYSASEGDLLEAIYSERRKELAGEGHHFFDLVRTNRAASEIVGFTLGKNEIFPIPFIELQIANAVDRWGQNPNY